MSLPNEKAELEAINIIKGLCFAQLTVPPLVDLDRRDETTPNQLA
jgi:hypothetical protein